MRVLLVTGSFPPMKCGVGDYSCNLAKSLAACAEIQIGVLTSVFDSNESEREGLEVFPIMKSWSLAETLKVIKVIRSWLPDIVHIQYPTQGCGIRITKTMSNEISEPSNSVQKRLSKRTDAARSIKSMNDEAT